ncbi:SGNH/GDSL hydrolase family protein [Ruminococcus sp. HUN007]|uniref:SGNH/GDSL hydrolase family protein n=1 Tax=Ruminococcus sp. HUN007 TaxID=1514668 RepID=UPI0005D1C37C|nr:SGNH/GDSL hydrolase family protein [Ruminococcus sp. HUN007]
MDAKKYIALICTAAVVLTGVRIGVSADATDNKTNETIKILPVGDSITDGYGTEGSYRKFLYNELTEAGYSIDMTGPNASWGDGEYTDPVSGAFFRYDNAHCGYSGYAIEEYPGRNGILETLKNGDYVNKYDPDIVILQIGTNDIIDNHEIDTAGKRLDKLVTYILQNIDEDDALFVTTIPDLDPNREGVYDWFANYRHLADWTPVSDVNAEKWVGDQIAEYNGQVKALVESKQKSGVKNIYFGDINHTITDVKSYLKDGVHPNDTGYKQMGIYWAGVIKEYLGNRTSSPEPSVTAAEPVITTLPSETTLPETTTMPVTTEPAVTTEPDHPGPKLAEPFPGDVNLDGTLNTADFTDMINLLTGKEHVSTDRISCDLNSDGKLNIADLILLKGTLMK